MELRSQEVRTLAPENDPLKMGMGWKVEDLSKPQIMVEVNDNGGKAARYFATDMCDGIAQGHDGINYSLPHRDAIVNLVEAQANASVYDGGVFIASCDKSVPAMLMSIGRLKDMSAIVVTGGVMEAHTLPKEYIVNDPACAINELLTLEQIGKFDAWEKTGVIPNSQLDYYKHNACPSCGACSFMGTASTMQIMAEALGLMLPGTALMPATAPELKQAAYDAGKRPDAPRRTLPAEHPSLRRLARTVLLLRRRRAPRDGGDQVHAASGRNDRHRQDAGRESGGAEEERLLPALRCHSGGKDRRFCPPGQPRGHHPQL